MKRTLLTLAIVAPLLGPSCLGPNNLFNSLRNWNAELSDQDWINEIVFLVLNIIPVYGVALLGDYIIFNTVDYWGDDNPIDDPGPFPPEWGKSDAD
jgi:hypothetical protein